MLLTETFSDKRLGYLRYFLGVKVARSRRGITLSQKKSMCLIYSLSQICCGTELLMHPWKLISSYSLKWSWQVSEVSR